MLVWWEMETSKQDPSVCGDLTGSKRKQGGYFMCTPGLYHLLDVIRGTFQAGGSRPRADSDEDQPHQHIRSVTGKRGQSLL